MLLSSYYTSRAAALTKLKQYDEALDDCKLALEFDQNAIKAHQRRARVYMQIGMFDKAIETYDKAIKIDTEAVAQDRQHTETTKRKYESAKATIEEQRGRKYGENLVAVRKAKDDLKTILKFCPDCDQARILQVEALFYSGDHTEAYQLASSLVKGGFSKDRELLILRARLMLTKGKIDDALKQLTVLSKRKSNDSRASSLKEKVEQVKGLMEQGEDAYKKKDQHRAIRYYSTAIDSCPDEAQGLVAKLRFCRSAAYASIGDHHKAIEDYNEILNYDPKHVKAHTRKGSSLLALKGADPEKNCLLAVKTLESALDICESTPLEDDVQQQLIDAQKQLRRVKMTTKDYFAILGVSTTANLADIYNAYRVRSLRIHNYKHDAQSRAEHDDAERQYQDISEAYELLSEASKTGALAQFAAAAQALRSADSPNARQPASPILDRRSDYDQRLIMQHSDDFKKSAAPDLGFLRRPEAQFGRRPEGRLTRQHSDDGPMRQSGSPPQLRADYGQRLARQHTDFRVNSGQQHSQRVGSPVQRGGSSSPRDRNAYVDYDDTLYHHQASPEYENLQLRGTGLGGGAYNDGYPSDTHPNDRYPSDIYPNDRYPRESYPNDRYPRDCYPDDGYPHDGYHKDVYQMDGYHHDGYRNDSYPQHAPPKRSLSDQSPKYNGFLSRDYDEGPKYNSFLSREYDGEDMRPRDGMLMQRKPPSLRGNVMSASQA